MLTLKKKKSCIGLSDFIMPFRTAHFNSFVVSTECYCIYLLLQRTEKNMTFQNVLFPMICPSSTSMGYLYFIFPPTQLHKLKKKSSDYTASFCLFFSSFVLNIALSRVILAWTLHIAPHAPQGPPTLVKSRLLVPGSNSLLRIQPFPTVKLRCFATDDNVYTSDCIPL